ncbi:MAG: tetratricopeptide repeat protein [Chitinispirillales bacterium]|jgi:tetratricopeptide (TPR) repeat protein|nr:tetratricopeptide repeat protein [Chitinispirillales bacterium]
MAAKTQESPVKILEQKLRNNPQSRAFSRLADMYRARGDIGSAIDLCLEGLAEHPNYVTGRLVLGRCYAEQKNFQAAIEELKKVCIADRRNHAAIKMLADTFIKIGRAEEAGGLYRVLFDMEPDNNAIKHLSAKHKSGDQKNIFDILGIKPVSLASSMQNLKSSGVDELADIQNLDTIQTDTSYSSPAALQFGNTGAVYQQKSIDEPTGGDIEKQLDSIFGDLGSETSLGNNSANPFAAAASEPMGADIENQLDAMFGTQAKAADPTTQNSGMDIFAIAPTSEPTGADIENQLDVMFGTQAQAAPPTAQDSGMDIFACAPTSEPTGADIENQLDAMFGTQTQAVPPTTQNSGMNMFAAAPTVEPTGTDIENQLDAMFGTQAQAAAPAVQDSGMDIFACAPTSEPTGTDIENQLDAMFGTQTTPPASQGNDMAAFAPAADESASGDPDGLNFLFAEPEAHGSGSEQDTLFFDSGMTDSSSANALLIDEPASDELLADDSALTGDDIEDKLNSLFGMTAPSGTQTDDSMLAAGQLDLADDTSAEQDVSGDDISSRIDELFAQHGDGSVAPDFSDTTPDLSGSQLPAPSAASDEVSGEDVESRMAELFKEPGKPADLTANSSIDELANAICGDSDYTPFDTGLSDQQIKNAVESAVDPSIDELANAICNDSDYAPLDTGLTSLLVDDQIQPPGVLLDLGSQNETADLIDIGNAEPAASSQQYGIDEDDVQEKIRQLFKSGVSEPETIDIGANFGEEEIDERDAALELPDHVLTPTLADIYFQQGQPKLSLQIYERLALRDPKDPRLQSKIQEIKDFLGSESGGAKKKM